MVAVRKEDVESEATLVAHVLKREIQDILGDKYKVVARADKFGLHVSSIFLMVHDVNPPYGIADNSPAHMKFMMHLTDNFGRPVDLDKVSFELVTAHYLQRKAGLKYRKISSNESIMNCATKLIRWFWKVKPQLDDLIGDYQGSRL